MRSNSHLPPETVDTVTFAPHDEFKIKGYVSTKVFQAHAAPIAAGTPPPEKAIPTDMLFNYKY